MKKLVKEGEINQYTDTCNCIMNTDYYNQMSVYNDKDRLRDHSKQAIPTSRPRYHSKLHPDVSILQQVLDCMYSIQIVFHSERGRFY